MKKLQSFLVMVLCALMVSGCAEEQKPQFAATVYPVEYLINKIGENYVGVHTISSDTIIQRSQLKQDAKSVLKECDALFYIGGLEPYMDVYYDDIRSTKVNLVNLETKSAIYKFERYTTTTINGITTGVEGPYYEGDIFKSTDVYDSDPMLWMDPVAMTSMANDIYDSMVAAHPEYEKIFKTNYEKLEVDLARLDADFQKINEEHMKISFVSMTPGFGIWQKSYGVNVYPVCLSKYGALPTTEQLEAIKSRIKADKVRYMVLEQNLPEDMIELQQQLIDELGLIPINMSNLSNISESDQKATKDYLTIMYENLKMLESMAS